SGALAESPGAGWYGPVRRDRSPPPEEVTGSCGTGAVGRVPDRRGAMGMGHGWARDRGDDALPIMAAGIASRKDKFSFFVHFRFRTGCHTRARGSSPGRDASVSDASKKRPGPGRFFEASLTGQGHRVRESERGGLAIDYVPVFFGLV